MRFLFRFRPTGWALSLVLAVGLTACDRELPEDPSGDVYYPLDQGLERTYAVIDTTYTTADTLSNTYIRREVNNGLSEDLTGRNLTRLEIYRADNDSSTSFSMNSGPTCATPSSPNATKATPAIG